MTTPLTYGGTTVEVSDEKMAKIMAILDEDKGKPKMREMYWWIDRFGEIDYYIWDGLDPDIKLLEAGNVYLTKEDVNNEILRRESMRNAWIPNNGEESYECWIFDNFRIHKRSFWKNTDNFALAILGMCHKTREAAEAWGKKYGPGFLALWKEGV